MLLLLVFWGVFIVMKCMVVLDVVVKLVENVSVL